MRYRILLIDDDPWMLSALSLFLTGERFDVDAADDAPSARERLNGATPDLVILKLSLGGSDRGWDLAREIRNRLGDIPMIMLVEGNDPVEELLVLSVEADAYVRKPYELRSLADKIYRALLQPAAASAEPRSLSA